MNAHHEQNAELRSVTLCGIIEDAAKSLDTQCLATKLN